MMYAVMTSVIGDLTIAADDDGLRHIEFSSTAHELPQGAWQLMDDTSASSSAGLILRKAIGQLQAYFAGTLRVFDLPLKPIGTDFQQAVWASLTTIPYGQTWSYARLAASLGKPHAVRAVGAANGKNPLPLVMPCHRVIGTNGSLTGFRGGLAAKEALLRLEGAAVPAQALSLF
jgi:methylated-DNA-[protein]-cysteine S-methyltransferase